MLKTAADGEHSTKFTIMCGAHRKGTIALGKLLVHWRLQLARLLLATKGHTGI